MVIEKTLLFTIAYNRFEMIRFSIINVITHAKNARYVIWDNGLNEELEKFCKYIIENNKEKSLEIIYFKSTENIGLNAAKKIVEKYSESCEFIMSIDEDILYLPFNFIEDLQFVLKQKVKNIGYVACNVFQDKLTNGAKPSEDKYEEIDIGVPVLLGPTGGWASMTSKKIYDKIGGFNVRSEKFFGLDGQYSKKCFDNNFYTCLSKNTICYHATGNIWNNRLGYNKVLKEKMDFWKKVHG